MTRHSGSDPEVYRKWIINYSTSRPFHKLTHTKIRSKYIWNDTKSICSKILIFFPFTKYLRNFSEKLNKDVPKTQQTWGLSPLLQRREGKDCSWEILLWSYKAAFCDLRYYAKIKSGFFWTLKSLYSSFFFFFLSQDLTEMVHFSDSGVVLTDFFTDTALVFLPWTCQSQYLQEKPWFRNEEKSINIHIYPASSLIACFLSGPVI